LKVIIAGSRTFSDYNLLKKELDKILGNIPGITIVSGGARGADRLGEKYARERGFRLEVYPADWERFGKSAGYRRNEKMARIADMLVAFWDGKSPGTRHMIRVMREKGKKVIIIKF